MAGDFREPAGFTDPPYEPDCPACDGTQKVEVTQVTRCDGKGEYLARSNGGIGFPWPDGVPVPEVDCPWCLGPLIRWNARR